MRKCNNCNREFDDSVDFCPTCGARLGDGPSAFEQQAAAAQIQPDQQAAQPPVPQPAPTVRPANSDPVTSRGMDGHAREPHPLRRPDYLLYHYACVGVWRQYQAEQEELR